jgi:hypothetical protein
MRPREFTVSKRQFQAEAAKWIQRTFDLSDYKRSLSAKVLAQLLVLAAALGCSLSSAAARTRRSPSDETVRKALRASLQGLGSDLEQKLAAGLLSPLPRRFFKRAHYLALDLHQRPYYGDAKASPVRGGKRQAGTSWFWTWASVAVVEHGRRWTLAATLALPGEPLPQIVARLLDRLEQAHIRVKLLLLDRGFYSAEVLALLQGRKLPFLMPVLRRGKGEGPKGPTGTQQFFQPGRRGFFTHQWRARGGKRPGPTVRVGVACAPRGRNACPEERPWVFIFDGFRPPHATWCRETYRRRFGIETSYRQLGECLALTTSRDAGVRLLLVGVALLLRNLWVWRQGQSRRCAATLSMMLHQLAHYASQHLELILDFEILKDPCAAT